MFAIFRHIFNRASCDRHALVPAFLQSIHNNVEKLLFMVFQANILIISKCVSSRVLRQLRKQIEVTRC